MTSYAFRMAAIAIGVIAAGFAAILIFGNIWVRSGIGAAVLVLIVVLLLIGWNVDRRDAARRAEYDDDV